MNPRPSHDCRVKRPMGVGRPAISSPKPSRRPQPPASTKGASRAFRGFPTSGWRSIPALRTCPVAADELPFRRASVHKRGPMTRAALLNGLRLITILAVILSAFPLVRGLPQAHAPEGSYEVQAGAEIGQPGHTHSHTHDDDADGAALPSHGHEYTDHSHVTLGLPTPPPTSMTAPQGRLVRAREGCPSASGPPYRLDRPPCQQSFA
jgi:hypothetical protein